MTWTNEAAQREYLDTGEIDAGLQAHMTRIYALMMGALIFTGLVAYVIGMDLKAVLRAQDPKILPYDLLVQIYGSPYAVLLCVLPMAFVLVYPRLIYRLPTSVAQLLFWAFGAVMGMSVALAVALYTTMSVAQIFFATAAAFGALSFYGYTTGRNLTGWGGFLYMGLFGVIVASVINLFIGSDTFDMIVSVVSILVFAGLTAYDTQRIKVEYLQMAGAPGGAAYLEKAAILGALHLYLSFVNLFWDLLNLFGTMDSFGDDGGD